MTALPHAFYPEASGGTTWSSAAPSWRWPRSASRDPRAGRLAGARRPAGRAATWRGAGGDTLNLYDTSALAHADLVQAHARGRDRAGLAVAEAAADRRAASAQLDLGARRAAADPFGAGARYDEFDAAPHAFGLAATARLYRR